jgi:hypothetical protein
VKSEPVKTKEEEAEEDKEDNTEDCSSTTPAETQKNSQEPETETASVHFDIETDAPSSKFIINSLNRMNYIVYLNHDFALLLVEE